VTNTPGTSRTRRSLIACAMTLCGLALALFAEPANAASEVGKNVGREVDTWAKAILLGTAALVGIPVFLRRDMGGALVLALLVVLVGGFVFAPGAVKDVIDGLWKAIGG
jgi:hypothetical protein